MNQLTREFWTRMEASEQKLSLVSEADARQPYRANGWSRKELLGHLVDSACVNHVRIMMAATSGSYRGSSYDQNGCVKLQGYAQTPWAAILDQWRSRNTAIAEMVTNIPEANLSALCTIGENPPMRLDELIRDYLNHLKHHVEQITSTTVAES
jgi:hypothetical protein